MPFDDPLNAFETLARAFSARNRAVGDTEGAFCTIERKAELSADLSLYTV